MPAPSRLAIATSALQRLVKEESSYHKELEQQQARISKLEAETGDENSEYVIKQEHKAMEETRAVFPSLRERIKIALEKLNDELELAAKEGQNGNTAEITRAKETITSARNHH